MTYIKAAFASGVVMLLGFARFNELFFEHRWRWIFRLVLLLGALALVWTLIIGQPTAFYVYAFVVVSIMVAGMASIRTNTASTTRHTRTTVLRRSRRNWMSWASFMGKAVWRSS